MEAYSKVHGKNVKGSRGGDGGEGRKLIEALEGVGEMRAELSGTQSQLSEATEKITEMSRKQEEAQEEMRKGMVSQNLGLEAAFNAANGRLDNMAGVQAENRRCAARRPTSWPRCAPS